MPAATVNSLSSSQVASLSYDQAASLMSNPSAASFSSSITSALNSMYFDHHSGSGGQNGGGGSGGQNGGGPGMATGAPPPPKPNGAPVNAFANVDPRLPQILLGLFPGSYTPTSAATASATKFNFFSIANSVPISGYCTNCHVGNLLYQYMEDQIVNGDNGTFVTFSM